MSSELAVIESVEELEFAPDLSGMSLADLAEGINRKHGLALEIGQRSLAYQIECGEFLLAAQAQVPQGEWGAWVTREIAADPKTVATYMRFATYQNILHEEGVTSGDAARQKLYELGLSRQHIIPQTVKREALRLIKKGHTQKEVALIFGVGQATISHWMHPGRLAKQRRESQRKRRLFAEAWQRQEKDRAARRVGGDLGKAYELTRKLAETLSAADKSEGNPFSKAAISDAYGLLRRFEDEINKAIGTHVSVEPK